VEGGIVVLSVNVTKEIQNALNKGVSMSIDGSNLKVGNSLLDLTKFNVGGKK
jgi:hypothetical protein